MCQDPEVGKSLATLQHKGGQYGWKRKIEEVLVPVVEEVVQSSRVDPPRPLDPPRPCEGVYYNGQWEGTRVLSKEWLDKNEQLKSSC